MSQGAHLYSGRSLRLRWKGRRMAAEEEEKGLWSWMEKADMVEKLVEENKELVEEDKERAEENKEKQV